MFVAVGLRPWRCYAAGMGLIARQPHAAAGDIQEALYFGGSIMTVIEVILPDGSIHAHLTDEREAVAIAQEVRQRYPQASYWRIGRGWHQAGVARRRTMSLDIWPRVAALAAVLALALAVAFLPPIRQTLLGAGGLTSVDLAPEADTSVPAPAEGPKEEGVTGGTTAVLDGVTPDEPALASQDIVIVSVAEQVSTRRARCSCACTTPAAKSTPASNFRLISMTVRGSRLPGSRSARA